MTQVTFTLLAAIASLCNGNHKCVDSTYQCFDKQSDRITINGEINQSVPSFGAERYLENLVRDCARQAKAGTP